MPEDKTIQELGLDEYKYGFRDPEEYFFRTPRKGIDEEIVARSPSTRASRSGCWSSG